MAAGEEVRLTLHDGERLTIADEDVPRVYENVWRLVPKPGAVTLAQALKAASRERPLTRHPVELTENQSAIIREAVEMPDP